MSQYEFDWAVVREGYALVCGVDEAGRGPLAGPVYAAAVILGGEEINGINDSKKLTEKKRDALYDLILQRAQTFCIASASHQEIDGLNILQASMLAMRRAVQGLALPPDMVLVDGNCDPALSIPTRLIVKGDATSAAIGAASILAKVARDRHLLELDALYPQYRFAKHKGYPTKLHYEMLDAFGSSPVHRQSFLRKWRLAQSGG